MIIDNADDLDMFQVAQDSKGTTGLKKFIPKSFFGSVLVTTRNRKVALELVDGPEIIDVPSLSKSESVELIRKRLHLSSDEVKEQRDHIDRLIVELECLPLALVQATAYIQSVPMTVGLYLQLYVKSEDSKMKFLDEGYQAWEENSGVPRSVSQTWKISFDMIQLERPSASYLLSLMAFLNRQRIPRRLLLYRKPYEKVDDRPGEPCAKRNNEENVVESGDEEGEGKEGDDDDGKGKEDREDIEDTEDTEEAEDVDGVEDVDGAEDEDEELEKSEGLDLQKDLGRLKTFALITESYEDGDYLYDLHRLVRLVIRHSLKVSRKVKAFESSALEMVAHGFPDPLDDRKRWLCALYRQHTEVVLRYSPRSSDETRLRATLLANVAMHLTEQGQPREGKRKAKESLELRKRISAQDGNQNEDAIISSMSDLATIYQELGKWTKAERFFQQTYELVKNSKEIQLADKLRVMGNLAQIYTTLQKLDDAERLQLTVLEEVREIDDSNSDIKEDELATRMDLSSTYISQGRWDEAEKTMKAVVDSFASDEGKGQDYERYSLFEWKCFGQLAQIYMIQGRWDEAQEMQVKVMDAMEKYTRVEKSGTPLAMDKYTRVKKSSILLIEEKYKPAKNPSTLLAMDQLATTYRLQGKWKEAETLQVMSVTHSTELRGADHPESLNFRGNLALLFNLQGRWKEAAELAEKVTVSCVSKFGLKHRRTLLKKGILATINRNQGRWEQAEDLGRHILETRKNVLALSEKHPDLLSAEENLAATYQCQGKYADAQILAEHVVKTAKSAMPNRHPLTLQYMRRLASIYLDQGKLEAAQNLALEAVNALKMVCGHDHPETITAMHVLATVFQKQEGWQAAEDLGTRVVELSKTSLTAKVSLFPHPDTLARMADLATTYRNTWRFKQAEQLDREALAALQASIGNEHWITLKVMSDLASTCCELRKFAEAEALGLEALQIMEKEHVLGEEHPLTLTAMDGLGWTFERQGQWDDAQQMGERALEISRRVLGQKHRDTRARMGKLASIYEKMWMFERTEELRAELRGAV